MKEGKEKWRRMDKEKRIEEGKKEEREEEERREEERGELGGCR